MSYPFSATLSAISIASLALVACNKSSEPTAKQPEAAAEAAKPAAETAKPAEGSAQQGSILIEGAGFKTPESMVHDATADVYLVSNINGSPVEADGNGFISRVSPQGKVVELKWIDGTKDGVELNAPKGLTIAGDLLYVADLDTLRMFDRVSGAAKGNIKIDGATFLNGVTTGPDGTVYVSDSGLKIGAKGFEPTGSDAVYKIENGKAVAVVKRGDLNRPNGLLADEEGLWMVTFGANELVRIEKDGKTTLQKLAKGSLDGLVRTKAGEMLISSWEGSSVFSGKDKGAFEEVISEVQSPADIGYDGKRDRVLIPLFQKDSVMIRSVSGS